MSDVTERLRKRAQILGIQLDDEGVEERLAKPRSIFTIDPSGVVQEEVETGLGRAVAPSASRAREPMAATTPPGSAFSTTPEPRQMFSRETKYALGLTDEPEQPKPRTSMAAMPQSPAAIPPEVAQYARERVSGIGDPSSRLGPTMPRAAPGSEWQPPAKEQFTIDAEDAGERERERGLERSRNVRGLAEGLELMGRSIGGISGGYTVDQPFGVTRGLDEEITRKEDYVPLATRRMLESKGIKVPEGARLSDLERVLPAVTRLTEGELDREAQQRAAQMQAIETQGKAAQPKEMSDKELADLQQIDDAIRSIRQLGKEREEKGYYTGPLDKMGAKLGEWSGMISPESSEWRRKVQTQLATYIHAMAGGALTPTEVQMYIGAIPHTGLQEEQFDAQVEGILGQLEDKRANMLKTRRYGGKKTEPFEKTTVRLSGGEEYAVPIGELREFVNAQQ